MKYSKVLTGSIVGFDVEKVTVEVDIDSRAVQQIFKIVGMPSTAILESQKRVYSALRNSGFKFPNGNVVVNLAPANQKKKGSHFDLPIAISILLASKQIQLSEIEKLFFFGELGLNGEIRPTSGMMAFLISLSEKFPEYRFAIPKGNEEEALFVENTKVFVLNHLNDLIEFANFPEKFLASPKNVVKKIDYDVDFSEVKGQEMAKRAAEIAAAGFHNFLMRGSPGSGKTMIARRIPTILAPMSKKEIIETTKIYSIAGYINHIVDYRPFRSPHHTSSAISIIGGGTDPKPGEVSLAHNGVLFLDELPEFKRDVMEALRQPLEDGIVTISRAKNVVTYPARFMLVAAQNPCPCGYFGDKERECTCTINQVINYNKKISGPIMDRIDIRIEVPRVKVEEILSKGEGESSESIRERVIKAFHMQMKRQGKYNSQLSSKELKRFVILQDKAEKILKESIKAFKISARGVNRILKVSRTIADLEESKEIKVNHILEAIQYRGEDIINLVLS